MKIAGFTDIQISFHRSGRLRQAKAPFLPSDGEYTNNECSNVYKSCIVYVYVDVCM